MLALRRTDTVSVLRLEVLEKKTTNQFLIFNLHDVGIIILSKICITVSLQLKSF